MKRLYCIRARIVCTEAVALAAEQVDTFHESRKTQRLLSIHTLGLLSIHTLQLTELGGLHVVGTERHESRRIDNQLRGRTGRQGDPGSTRFFLSLEDNIFRIFGGDKIQGLMTVRAPVWYKY